MEVLLNVFCSTFPSRLLAYAPFWDNLRFGKRVAVATLAVSMALELLLLGWVIQTGHPEWVRAVEFLFAPVGLAACCVNIRLSPSQVVFSYLMVVDYLMIVAGVAAHGAVTLFGAGSRSWQSSMLCLVLYLVSWPAMYRLYRSAAQQVYRVHAPALWRVIWLAPALTTATVLLFTASLQDDLVGNWRFLFARIGLLICVLIIYRVLVQALAGLQRQVALEEQLKFETHLLEVQVAEQKKHHLMMVENTWQLRQQSQDLRNQLTAIRALARPDNEPLQAYIDSLMQSIPAAPQIFCENPAVNALVSHYASLCQTQGITFTARITVPADTRQISDGELCVLFGNLLENGTEACGRMTDGDRFIQIRTSQQYDTLTITMENSFDGVVQVEKGRYRSSKRPDFGIGLTSIQAVARKYRGDARFAASGKVFRSSVYVRI